MKSKIVLKLRDGSAIGTVENIKLEVGTTAIGTEMVTTGIFNMFVDRASYVKFNKKIGSKSFEMFTYKENSDGILWLSSKIGNITVTNVGSVQTHHVGHVKGKVLSNIVFAGGLLEELPDPRNKFSEEAPVVYSTK